MPEGYPGAMLLDLDDTILAFDRDAATMWLKVSLKFEDRLRGVTPQQLADSVEEFRAWYWSDPVRHRIARLDLLKARRDVMAGTFERLGVDDPDLADEIGVAYADARDAAIIPFPGAIEAIEAFRGAGVGLALVTNGSSDAQRSKINRFGLEPLFDHVQIEGEFGAGKPEPSVYLHALEQVGGTPSDAWMVGDNLEWEVAAPQRLGITGIWHDWRGGGLPPESTVRPDRIISSLTELATSH